jgi:hypothetical protein
MLLPGPIAGFLVEQHAATKTAIPSIKLRRRTAAPEAQSLCGLALEQQQGNGFGGLHGSNPEPLMSALGQKQTFPRVWLMSALPPKADIDGRQFDVRFVPKADELHRSKTGALFDHLVGAGEQCRSGL